MIPPESKNHIIGRQIWDLLFILTLTLGTKDTLTEPPVTKGPRGPIVSLKHTIAYNTSSMSKRTKDKGRLSDVGRAASARVQGSGEFERQHEGQ